MAIKLLPNKIVDILNPSLFRNSLGLVPKAITRKSRDQKLDDFIAIAKHDVTRLNISDFSEITPDFPSIKSPELHIKPFSDPRIKDLEIHPLLIIQKIWNTITKFVAFKALEPDMIPELVYMNLFEGNKILVTQGINYIAIHNDVERWLINLNQWYTDSDKNGWASLFRLKTTDDRVYKMFYDMAVYMVCMYYFAVTRYQGTDLVDYWKITVEERQGGLLAEDPNVPPMRFTFKYSSIYTEEPQQQKKHIQHQEGIELYYIVQLNATITELKRVITNQCISNELNVDLGYWKRFERWREVTKQLLNSVKNDKHLKLNGDIYFLYKQLKLLNKELISSFWMFLI